CFNQLGQTDCRIERREFKMICWRCNGFAYGVDHRDSLRRGRCSRTDDDNTHSGLAFMQSRDQPRQRTEDWASSRSDRRYCFLHVLHIVSEIRDIARSFYERFYCRRFLHSGGLYYLCTQTLCTVDNGPSVKKQRFMCRGILYSLRDWLIISY